MDLGRKRRAEFENLLNNIPAHALRDWDWVAGMLVAEWVKSSGILLQFEMQDPFVVVQPVDPDYSPHNAFKVHLMTYAALKKTGFIPTDIMRIRISLTLDVQPSVWQKSPYGDWLTNATITTGIVFREYPEMQRRRISRYPVPNVVLLSEGYSAQPIIEPLQPPYPLD